MYSVNLDLDACDNNPSLYFLKRRVEREINLRRSRLVQQNRQFIFEKNNTPFFQSCLQNLQLFSFVRYFKIVAKNWDPKIDLSGKET